MTPSAATREAWSKEHASATADAYVPLTFAPGEAYQFDWSHEIVVMDGVTTTVKVAHRPPLPQPHDVRARLSARDAGDGVRRPRAGVRVLQGRLLRAASTTT